MSYGLLITTYDIQIFKYICVGYDQYKLIKYKSILFKLLMTSFKMLLFLFFLHLIKYSQRNVNMSHYDCIFFLFLYIYWFFLYVSLFLDKVSNGFWCLPSLWIAPFIIKNIHLCFTKNYYIDTGSKNLEWGGRMDINMNQTLLVIQWSILYREENEIELGLWEGALKRMHSRNNRAT